jgi:PKD repeat protein
MKNIKNLSINGIKTLVLILFVLTSCEEDLQYTSQDTNLPTSKYMTTAKGLNVTFSNESAHATQYLWDFGDGQTSIEVSPEHLYVEKKEFTVSLTSIDGNGVEDVFTSVIPVGFPVAGFDYSVERATGTFANTSDNATGYLWDFGDDTTSTEENPVHLYPRRGNYVVKLKATSGIDESIYEESIFVPGKFIPEFLAPGFEVSDYRSLWDWNGLSSSGAPTPPDGGRGAKFGSNDWLAQTLQVDPDEFYTIKFWFVTKKTELPIGVKFLITDADNPSNIILDTSTGPSASSGEYEEISFLFETGSASNITVRLDYGDGEARIDLFSIE